MPSKEIGIGSPGLASSAAAVSTCSSKLRQGVHGCNNTRIADALIDDGAQRLFRRVSYLFI